MPTLESGLSAERLKECEADSIRGLCDRRHRCAIAGRSWPWIYGAHLAAAVVIGWFHWLGACVGDVIAANDLLALTPALLGIISTRPAVQSNHVSLNGEMTVRKVQPREWEQLLEQFPHHTVFHTLPWLETIQSVHNARLRLAAAERGGRCVAVWPAFETRKGPLRILGSPLPGWSTAYMGPLFEDERCVEPALEAFLNHPLFTKCSYFACKVFNDQFPVDLHPYGFNEVLKFDTYCVDLTQPEETLWSKLKSECRTQIRKARKIGMEVREEPDGSFLDDYWTMSVETFAVCSLQPTFTRPFLFEMWERLRAVNCIRAFSAWKDGERVAALVLPYDSHAMYYWAGGSYFHCRGLPSHNLLHWEAITQAKRMGLNRYDFISTLGGAGRFKKTFGPEMIHIATHWERSSSRLIQAIKDQYERYLMRRQKVKGVSEAT